MNAFILSQLNPNAIAIILTIFVLIIFMRFMFELVVKDA